MTTDFEMGGETYCIVDENDRVAIYKYFYLWGGIRAGRVPCFDQPKLYDAYMLWRKQEGAFADMTLGEFIGKMSGDPDAERKKRDEYELLKRKYE